MTDIFISYSSTDREQAEQLTEMLISAGLSVWIDRRGIAGAEKWATEIVEGISSCSTFLLLLSPASVASTNVLKELSLASEKGKRILPVDLQFITLPSSFEYPLAGLQRVPFLEFDRILHAHRYGVSRVSQLDTRKSLIILPFEDQSPGQDNLWFADGLAGEMIDALGHIKTIRVLDRKTSKDLRGVKQTAREIGELFNTRYLVQGAVTKVGDRIKVSTTLLDIHSGENLWQDSFKGVIDDIFELQENIAEKVVEALQVHLTFDEKQKLADHGTENAEAYELILRAFEYSGRETKEGFEFGLQLITEAIGLDPGYANAYQFKANILAALFRTYDRDPTLLEEAERLCQDALRLKPNFFAAYYPLSYVYMLQRRHEEAEATAKKAIQLAPDNYFSHFSLGFYYSNIGQNSKAIAPFEESVRLNPEYRTSLFNLVLACHEATTVLQDESYREKCITYAKMALPVEERFLKLHPDDESSKLNYAFLLVFSGRKEDALKAMQELKDARDGKTLYNTACLFALLDDKQEALVAFRKSIEAGFKNLYFLKEFLTGNDGVPDLAGTLEYEEVKQLVEQLETEEKSEKTTD